MTDPSPEERARRIIERGDFHSLYGIIKTEIIAAIEARDEEWHEALEISVPKHWGLKRRADFASDRDENAVLAETERIIQIIWDHRQKAKWELWKSGLVAEIRRDPKEVK